MDTSKIKPFGRRIYIEPIKENTVIEVQNIAMLTEVGKVIEVGEAVVSVVPGDTILFTIWGADSVTVNNKKLYFILETDEFILAKI